MEKRDALYVILDGPPGPDTLFVEVETGEGNGIDVPGELYGVSFYRLGPFVLATPGPGPVDTTAMGEVIAEKFNDYCEAEDAEDHDGFEIRFAKRMHRDIGEWVLEAVERAGFEIRKKGD